MNDLIFRIVPLAREHDKEIRERFNCGCPPLDRYFRERVTQDVRNNYAKCYVALVDRRIVGFYTLSSSQIKHSAIPPEIAMKLPRYEDVPTTRIGRLAVDTEFKGKKLGSIMLYDACKRIIGSPMGNYAVIVDAKDKNAKDFYLHHGFIEMPDKPNTLFLPLATVARVK